MQHVIRKQCFELTVESRAEAFRVQQLVSEEFRRRLMPALTEYFDASSLPDKVHRLDRIEIDLGRITEKDILSGRWVDMIVRRMEDQLAVIANTTDQKGNSLLPAGLNTAEQWLYYMQFGHLHWSVIVPGPEWEMKALEIFATDAAAAGQLAQLICKFPHVAMRVIKSYNEKFLVLLAGVLSARNQSDLGNFISRISRLVYDHILSTGRKVISSADNARAISQKMWVRALVLVAVAGNKASFQVVAIKLLCEVFPGLNTEAVKSFKENSSGSTMMVFVDRIGELLKDNGSTKRKSDNSIDVQSADHLQVSDSFVDGSWDGKEIIPKPPAGAPDTIFGTAADLQDYRTEGLYVPDCGLVLLHPFLAAFFSRLNYTIDKVIRPELMDRAVCILNFLATGNTDAHEYELVVPKILCGCALHQPVEQVVLTDEEMAEGENLLVAVISHWEILRGTSPAGLRESFLQRNGKVTMGDEGVKIQIEASSIDVLLDHLPWNISMIKLPWNEGLLRVEWR